ncbi:hypothetical protein PLESTB_001393700 [Pleodorina starrii]|uniref:Sugar phosphate transporter domain-containing protein n=1 Tax=Pleodorina starrii TaxID=330485 RepID=A0A9W6F723_9CHLO|nr:hypothetical protein PLESTM_000538600 [Pleodorina starrii]GLC58723.1 hypothetical protein PLESTB_001393700 [Pleodorina starrii]GLC75191.1 hypothetical protein PLESTF_001605300 [Pleodorina starrii]
MKVARTASHVLGEHSSSLWPVLTVVVVSAAWMTASSALIILNKYIMVALLFEYPMALTCLGMFMSGLLAFVCCHVLRLVKVSQHLELRFWLYRVLPIGLLMAITLWTGNEVYLHLTVAFIQMLKALNPVITMICLFVAGLETPNRQIILSVLLTALGTAAAAYGEVNLNMYGVFLMLMSETAESIRLVMTQFLLVGLNFHPIEGLMYLASTCCLWLLLGCLLVEVPEMRRRGAMDVVWENPSAFLCTALLGFAVNALAYFVIKLASSLTLKVLATAKNTMLVVCGMLMFGEAVTGFQGIGYLISLTGFTWYQWLKIGQLAALGSSASHGWESGGGGSAGKGARGGSDRGGGSRVEVGVVARGQGGG